MRTEFSCEWSVHDICKACGWVLGKNVIKRKVKWLIHSSTYLVSVFILVFVTHWPQIDTNWTTKCVKLCSTITWHCFGKYISRTQWTNSSIKFLILLNVVPKLWQVTGDGLDFNFTDATSVRYENVSRSQTYCWLDNNVLFLSKALMHTHTQAQMTKGLLNAELLQLYIIKASWSWHNASQGRSYRADIR